MSEFPKWVPVHSSHLVGHVAPEFSATDMPRGGVPMVLVADADEEAKAVNPKFQPEPAENAPEGEAHE